MNFLGQLGIDFNLVIAQAVNFGILVFVLFKFVYKPIFKKIEEDEGKIREVQAKSESLDTEKQAFEIEKDKTLKDAKQNSETLLTQAEQIAEDIKAKALKKAEGQADEIISQARHEVSDSKSESTYSGGSELAEIFSNKKLYSELDSIFFERLMTQMKTDAVHFKDIGNVIIESVHPLSVSRKTLLASFVKRYLGEDKKVEERENKTLIVGFRVLTGKVAIDQNLFFEINNAKQYS